MNAKQRRKALRAEDRKWDKVLAADPEKLRRLEEGVLARLREAVEANNPQ